MMTFKKTSAIALALMLLLAATSAFATHFRYGTLTTRVPDPAQPHRIEIVVELAFRTQYFVTNFGVTPTVGVQLPQTDVITLSGPGYSQQFALRMTPTVVNNPEGWFVGRAVIPVTLTSNLAGTFTALYTNGDRISTLRDRNNDTVWRLAHTFLVAAGGVVLNNGPSLAGLPLRTIGVDRESTFQVPAGDPDGDALQFRLATTAESGLPSPQPKTRERAGFPAPVNDPNFTFSSTGVMTWTPTRINCNPTSTLPPGAPAGTPTLETCLYSIQALASDGRGATTPFEFLLDVVQPTGLAPTLKIDGSTSPVTKNFYVGVEGAVQISAVDNDSLVLELIGTSLPQGATLTPSLPILQPRTGTNASASTVMTWTPTLGQQGGQVIEFAANDQDGNEVTNFVTANIALAEFRYVTGVIRDFIATDPGFARADGDNAIPIVQSMLGADGKPVFNSAVAGQLTTIPGGAATFNQFFNKAPAEFRSFVLNNGGSANPDVFSFNGTDFRDGDQYFTYEAHTYLTYQPGMILNYSSSDDLWVFVNGRLVVDLGGVHTAPRTAVLDLDARVAQLGLVAGGTYPMDIFYAHRGGSHVPSIGLQVSDVPFCSPLDAPVPVTLPTLAGGAQTVGATTRLSTANAAAGSGVAWTATQREVTPGFSVEFDFKMAPAVANGGEGFAFVIQGSAANARGGDGANLGYAGIDHSIAVEFDTRQTPALTDPAYEHGAVHFNGGMPTGMNSAAESFAIGRSLPSLSSPVDLNDNQVHHVRIEYQPGPVDSSMPPGTPRYGWIRVWLDDALNPFVMAQIDSNKVSEAFPSGFGWFGFTTGSMLSPNTTATIDVTNFKIGPLVVSGALSHLTSAPAAILPDSQGSVLLQLRDICSAKVNGGGQAASIAATMTAGTYSTPVTITDMLDGTYRLSYTPRVGGNWILNVTVGGIPIQNNPALVMVLPATPTLSATGGTFDYNGLPRAATGAATGVFGEALGGLTFTYNGAAAAIDAGDYDVVGSYAGNAHYAAATTDADLTILPIAPTVTVGNTTVIYNGQPQTATGVVKGIGGVVIDTPTFSYTPASPVDAGTYAVVGSYAGSTNYTPATGNGSLRIDPATPTVTVTDVSTTYDGQPHPAFAVVTGVNGVVLAPATLRYDGNLAPPVNAGSYVVAATVDAAGNYTAASGSGLVSIAKATPTVEVSSASFTYDAASHTVAATVKGVNNTVIGVPDAITYGGLSSPPISAGTYAVLATFAETANYVAANGGGTLTIDPATPTVVVNDASHVYDGAAHASTGSVTGVGGEVLGPLSFTYDGDSASPIDVKSYHVVASFTGGGNYTGATGEGTLAITPATPSVVVNSATFVYDGQPHAVTGTVLGVGEEQLGSLTFTYDGNAASPVDAKIYQVVATFAASGNYGGATATGTLEITRATPLVNVNGGTFTYDGQPHAAIASVTGVGGVSLGGASTITYNGAVASPRDAASYSVVASFDATTNYESATGNGTILINRAPLVITAGDKTMEEGSTVPALTASYAGFVNGETAAVLDTPVSLSTTATSSSPAGAYPITAAGAADANYDISFAAGVMTVTPRPEITPGFMVGHGFVRDDDNRYDFDFTVRERANGSDRGRLELKIKDEDRKGKKKKGAKNRDDRFVSRQLTKVFFSDDPTTRPGRSRKPQVDTVLFEGTGEWNGRSGYRFEAFAQDLGEPGRHRETIRITVFDSNGLVVAHVEGDLDGGNIQSARIRH